jgi:hypothetical protein
MEKPNPSNTRRKNVRKARGPIRNVTKKRTHRCGKLHATKTVLETICTTKHVSCGEETTDFICVPKPT